MSNLLLPMQGAGKEFLIAGLDWILSAGAEDVESITTEHEEATAFLVLSNGTDNKAGFSSIKTPKKTYSVAALCAEYARRKGVKHAVFKLGLEGESFLIVGVLDGLPNLDKVGTATEIESAHHQFANNEADVVNLVLFSGSEDAEVACDLVSVLHLLDEKGVRSQVCLKKIPKSFPIWWGLVGVAVLASAGYIGWGQWQEYKALEAARLAQANAVPPQQRYEQDLAKNLIQSGWGFSEAIKAIDAVMRIPEDVGGWKLEKVACSYAAQGCDLKWKQARPGATFRSFLEERSNVDVTFTNDNITEQLRFKTEGFRPVSLAELRSPKHHYVGMISNLQRIAATGDATLAVGAATAYPGLETGINQAYQTQISVSNAALYLLPVLFSQKEGVGHVSVASFEMSISDKPTFSVIFNLFTSAPK